MTIRDWAARYVALGWAVIPLQPRSKELAAAGFDMKSPLRLGVEDFRPDDGIGIRSVDGYVVSDADADLAVRLSDAFLPATGTVWGRPSKPRAKRLYRCRDLESNLTLTDADGHHIIQLRVNHQDVAPPSIHPSGEELAWSGEPGPAAEVDIDTLTRAHRLLATATVLATHYPAAGARHEWTLALAGLLRHINLSQEETEHLLSAIAPLVDETKLPDRHLEVRTTYARGADDPVVGGRKLDELSNGKHLTRTIRRLWGDVISADAISKIERLNETHAVLFQQSGDLIVLTESEEHGAPLLRFSRSNVMGLLYPEPIQVGTNARGDARMAPLGEAWLRSPRRRFYAGIELAPNSNGPQTGYYNLWRGWAVEPKKGDWSLFHQHLELITHGDPDWTAYLMKWLAETVQHPDRPIGTSLAFRGKPGTGKSTFARWFGALFGPHFLHLDSEQRLLGRFNAHLHNAIVVFADEAVWAGGKQGLGALKRMITEDTLAIERKGIDTLTVKNMIHLMVASNEDWFVPATLRDRRFAIFEIDDARANDRRFFAAVNAQLFEQGGLAALLYDLLEWRSDVDLGQIPQTPERAAQRELTFEPRVEWWYECLCDELWWPRPERPPQVDRDTVYEHYMRVVAPAHSHVRSLGSRGALGRFLQKMLPEGWPQTMRGPRSHGRRHLWVFPNLIDSRRHFEVVTGLTEWPKESEVNESDSDDAPPF